MELCLVTAAAVVRLGTMALTLGWTHSIEKVRWEEDYRATPAGVVLLEDRVQGSGAGMDPPPDAKFDGMWWRYNPHLSPLPEVILRRSGMTVGDWQVCMRGTCKDMSAYVGATADPVTLKTCP